MLLLRCSLEESTPFGQSIAKIKIIVVTEVAVSFRVFKYMIRNFPLFSLWLSSLRRDSLNQRLATTTFSVSSHGPPDAAPPPDRPQR